jgi:Cu/Ag efflux protein CusF
MKKLLFVRLLLAVMALCLVFPPAYGQGEKDAKKKEYVFQGKIEKISADARTLTVNGAEVPGWMAAMTMDYAVDKPETIKTLKVGDQITAKVFDGDFRTLYDVKVTPPKK